jgi:hypothetical protein
MQYFTDRLGLAVPDVAVLPEVLYTDVDSLARLPAETQACVERVEGHPARWMDGFVTDRVLTDLARRTGKRTVSDIAGSVRGNNKLLLHNHLLARGLPVFDTHTAEAPGDVGPCLDALRSAGYARAVVKAQIGASGIGLIRVDIGHPGPIPDYMFHEGPCMVQGWLDETVADVRDVRSPSVQLFVGEDALTLYDITDQILGEDSVHEGNIAPPPSLRHDPSAVDELLRQAVVAGTWLHAQGYRGTGSVDFHVVERRGALEIRVCELNARVTGATYPSILARRFFPGGTWLMRNLRFDPPIHGHAMLQRLDEASLLFAAGQSRGALPINFNRDAGGNTIKGQFLCIGESEAEVRDLLDAVARTLPAESRYDRD